MQRAEVLKPRITWQLCVAFVLSLLVHSFTVILAVIGIHWLVIGIGGVIRSDNTMLFVLFGPMALVTAWATRPRLDKAPECLPREAFPTLFELADRIAD